MKLNFLAVGWFSLAVPEAEFGVALFCSGDRTSATLGICGRPLAAACSQGEILEWIFGTGAPRCLQEGSLWCLWELCQILAGETILLPPKSCFVLSIS